LSRAFLASLYKACYSENAYNKNENEGDEKWKEEKIHLLLQNHDAPGRSSILMTSASISPSSTAKKLNSQMKNLFVKEKILLLIHCWGKGTSYLFRKHLWGHHSLKSFNLMGC
jgi:hypothetical protein